MVGFSHSHCIKNGPWKKIKWLKLYFYQLFLSSYAARESPNYEKFQDNLKSRSRSKSASPENAGAITYITSFGGEEANPEAPRLV